MSDFVYNPKKFVESVVLIPVTKFNQELAKQVVEDTKMIIKRLRLAKEVEKRIMAGEYDDQIEAIDETT